MLQKIFERWRKTRGRFRLATFLKSDVHSQSFVKPIDVLNISKIKKINTFIAADPFIANHEDVYKVYFEALNDERNFKRKGFIASIEVSDTGYFQYNTVKSELEYDAHNSYPQIKWFKDSYCLTVDNSRDGLTNVFTLNDPRGLPISSLNTGALVDCTFFEYNGEHYMYGGNRGRGVVELFCLTSDGQIIKLEEFQLLKSIFRPGGTPFFQNGKLLCPFQEYGRFYGERLYLFELEKNAVDEKFKFNFFFEFEKGRWNSKQFHHISINKECKFIVADGSKKGYLSW